MYNLQKEITRSIIGFVLFVVFTGCAVPNYYPNISKPSPFAKKMTAKEKRCPSTWYANRIKRYYNN